MTQAHATIRPRPGVLEIAPYVGGSSTIEGANRTIKLSANENPFGPSQQAIEAYRAVADALGVYPESHAPLINAIADVHGVEPDRVVCGAGSDELIALLCKAYAGPGDEVLFSEHGFLMYRLSALAAGATPVTAPERELTTDVNALIQAMSPRTRLVFVANPNNPTGTLIDGLALARLADALPPEALLVVDAAYAEYLRDTDDDGALELVRQRDNIVMTRTFSKIYGLGALRLGWCYAPDHVIDVLNRVRGPFNVTAPALAAGTAAVRDQDWVEHCRITNEVWRDWLTGQITEAGLGVTRSKGNFVLINAGDRVEGLDQALKSRGLIGRRVDPYGLPGHLRVSIGDETACRLVAEVVRGFAGTGRP